jgi:tetratricopeptide (TPR) repeat protein
VGPVGAAVRANGGSRALADWGPPYGAGERARYEREQQENIRRLLLEGHVDEVASMAATGTVYAKARLAEYYAEHGRWENLHGLTTRPTPHLIELLRLVVDPGDMPLEAAVTVLKVRMVAWDDEAFRHVIDLLYQRGLVEHALDELLAGAGTPPDWKSLDCAEWHLRVYLLLREDRVVEALAMADAPRMRSWLAPVLAERGHVDALRTLARPGETGFALLLARTLIAQGRVEEGIAIMQQRIDAGEESAYQWTVDLLVELGHVDRALKVLRSRPYQPHAISNTAGFNVAQLLDEHGRHEEAIEVLRTYSSAPKQLAELLAGLGRMDEAMAVLDAALSNIIWRYVTDELAEHQAALLARYGMLRELHHRTVNGHPEYREIMRSHLTHASQPGRGKG